MAHCRLDNCAPLAAGLYPGWTRKGGPRLTLVLKAGLALDAWGTLRLLDPRPRIEQGPKFIERPGHRPPPAGFGPLPPFWEPRASAAGTPRAHPAEAGGCPVNDDSEPDLFNCAPSGQRLPRLFTGGEALVLSGFFPGAREIRLVLPALAIGAMVVENGTARRLEPVTDTLVIDTDAMALRLVGRAGLPWDPVAPGGGHVIVDRATAAVPATHAAAEARAS